MFPEIKNLLLGSPDLVVLVDDRVYPDQLPEAETLPGISLSLVSTVYRDLTDGTRLITAENWQINCIAMTRMDASHLATAVYHALHLKSGGRIKKARVISKNDELPAAGVSLRRTLVDVEIKYYEP